MITQKSQESSAKNRLDGSTREVKLATGIHLARYRVVSPECSHLNVLPQMKLLPCKHLYEATATSIHDDR